MNLSGGYTETDFLSFHNTKDELPAGVYKVEEFDRTFSYAVIERGELGWLIDITWLSETAYERALQAQYDDMRNDAFLLNL